MGFSFSRFGFWKLAIIGLLAEMFHLLLQLHWPEIRGSHQGIRTLAALAFMTGEVLVVLAALAAGIGIISKGIESRIVNIRLLPIGLAMAALIVVFIWVWH